MEARERKCRPESLRLRTVSAARALLRIAQGVVFAWVLVLASFTGRGVENYGAALDRRFAAPHDSTNVIIVHARTDTNLVAIEQALQAEQRVRTQGPPLPPEQVVTPVSLVSLSLVALVMIFVILRLVRYLNVQRLKLLALAREADEKAQRDKRIFEDPTMQNFFTELQFGMTASPAQVLPDALVALKSMQDHANEAPMDLAAANQEFLESAPGTFMWLRMSLTELMRTTNDASRQKLLLEFSQQVRAPKIACLMPALRSYWLLAFALEGFTRQLSRKASEVTPSVAKTIEGALELLEILSTKGLRADLASEPPIRLLAVDDNAVCLRSMFFALKKVFPEPDLAPEGKTALAQIEQHAYDVIFLDVDMPGMNGFEVCDKIRQSNLNKATPVVFVTRHSDFESRAKSTQVGGQDLIGKPYLPAEITVKTLMLVLRNRIELEAAKLPTAPDKINAEEAAPESSTNSTETTPVTATSA